MELHRATARAHEGARPRHPQAELRALIVGDASRRWRRQLGALAWAALEELALGAHRDDRGWAAPVGVRDIAAGVGTTRESAARAVAALGAAGLVALEQVSDGNGWCRSGYRLWLPEGIERNDRPSDHDAVTRALPEAYRGPRQH